MNKIIEGLSSALAVAKGEQYAARILWQGLPYVPEAEAKRLECEIERLRAELEVSEAVNRAKTELLVDLKALLTQNGQTPAQRARNALVEIQVRTGPPKSDAHQQSMTEAK